MTTIMDGGTITGTKDAHYNLIWFTDSCLRNALRLENYLIDARREGDSELVDLFERAQRASRKGAEEGKRLLAVRLNA